jgi:hypothetical protein
MAGEKTANAKPFFGTPHPNILLLNGPPPKRKAMQYIPDDDPPLTDDRVPPDLVNREAPIEVLEAIGALPPPPAPSLSPPGAAATTERQPPASATTSVPRIINTKDLPVYSEGDDPKELIRHHYLHRGQYTLLCGPTDVGKSTFVFQMSLCFALGRDCFGIQPARPLRSLIFHSELIEDDVGERFKRRLADALQLTPGQRDEAFERIDHYWAEAAGPAFLASHMRPALEHLQAQGRSPDLVVLEPLLGVFGADVSNQEKVSAFVRHGLIPLLKKYHAGGVIVAHTNKTPSIKSKSDWFNADYAYAASGSSDLANAARGVLVLQRVSEDDVFELRAAKQGRLLKWPGDATIQHIAWDKSGLWVPAQPPSNGHGHGAASQDELVALLPPEGLTTKEWQQKASDELGVSKATFHRLKKRLAQAERVLKSEVTDKWQPIRPSKR